ncbi:hypothetical protein LPB140_00205 [Sphingorhabdus lutea]|uniref:Uncharacterized protein n=1 Tax=Sphingorhabdus lutea TaxID=1913578 RepID=A0A1L3J8U1_9SPHN|nr:hypothetical protein [Sphingorhabdus lutea]APG61523.1 hypothetical protein LPB140_00205 [Sphingorhabdus lutea]
MEKHKKYLIHSLERSSESDKKFISGSKKIENIVQRIADYKYYVVSFNAVEGESYVIWIREDCDAFATKQIDQSPRM